jgi:MEDS: MEthanogen/methylotroph, DcmR Sensory domain
MGEPTTVAMGFTEECFPGSSHICLVYENDDQRQRVVSEYLATGVRNGELVRYFTDATPPERIRSWLGDTGVEVLGAEQRGSFSISSAESAYCPDGRFEPRAMIAGSVQRYGLAEKAGYTGMRSCGEMSWVLKGRAGSERFLEYEALLNTVTAAFPHVGMCQYDARLFDGATLFKVLQIHPFMVAQGQVVRNPYYTRPEEFLAGIGSAPVRS